MISTQELIEFKERNNIVIKPVDCAGGVFYSIVSGCWNFADPFECMAAQELVHIANGVGE